jgi:hypothetical protein
VAVAAKAHRYYRPLVRAYTINDYTSKVDRITRRQLNRAAQAVANLVVAIRGSRRQGERC